MHRKELKRVRWVTSTHASVRCSPVEYLRATQVRWCTPDRDADCESCVCAVTHLTVWFKSEENTQKKDIISSRFSSDVYRGTIREQEPMASSPLTCINTKNYCEIEKEIVSWSCSEGTTTQALRKSVANRGRTNQFWSTFSTCSRHILLIAQVLWPKILAANFLQVQVCSPLNNFTLQSPFLFPIEFLVLIMIPFFEVKFPQRG